MAKKLGEELNGLLHMFILQAFCTIGVDKHMFHCGQVEGIIIYCDELLDLTAVGWGPFSHSRISSSLLAFAWRWVGVISRTRPPKSNSLSISLTPMSFLILRQEALTTMKASVASMIFLSLSTHTGSIERIRVAGVTITPSKSRKIIFSI